MANDTPASTFVTGISGFIGNRQLRVLRVPAVATRLVVGPVLGDHVQTDAVCSNIRLRGTGFRFEYPTIDQGLRQVLGALHE